MAIKRPPMAARTRSAIGLQANRWGKARTTAGIPSRRTRPSPVYGPGDFFFESGNVSHTAQNKTDAPMVHVLLEIPPAEHWGPSIMPAIKH